MIVVRANSAPSEFEPTKTTLGLKQRMGVLRRLTGTARILFDLTDYPGPSDEATARFQHVDGEFVQDNTDRFALIAPRFIDKVTAQNVAFAELRTLPFSERGEIVADSLATEQP